jgi:hypothetical protein
MLEQENDRQVDSLRGKISMLKEVCMPLLCHRDPLIHSVLADD